MNYKNLINLFIAIVLLVNCSTNDDTMDVKSSNILQDCKIAYLMFDDGIRNDVRYLPFDDDLRDNTTLSLPLDVNPIWNHELDSIIFNYKSSNLIKVIGGFGKRISYNGNYNIFSNSLYDSIFKLNNTYQVYTKPYYLEYYSPGEPEKPYEYIVKNNKIQKIVKKDGFFPLNYLYEDNVIIEKTFSRDSVEFIRRKFYLNNNNLTKVEFFGRYNTNDDYENPEWSDYVSKEIFFKEYDSSPNPFHGKYYLQGAFYRSFSENNYRSVVINQYEYRYANPYYIQIPEAGTIQLIYTNQYTTPFEYNEENYPLFGNYK